MFDRVKHSLAMEFDKQQTNNKIKAGLHELLCTEIKARKEHQRKQEIMEQEHRQETEKRTHHTDNEIRENYHTELDKAIIRLVERELARKGNKGIKAQFNAEFKAEQKTENYNPYK